MAKKGKGGRKAEMHSCPECHKRISRRLEKCPDGQCRPTVSQAAMAGRVARLGSGRSDQQI